MLLFPPCVVTISRHSAPAPEAGPRRRRRPRRSLLDTHRGRGGPRSAPRLRRSRPRGTHSFARRAPRSRYARDAGVRPFTVALPRRPSRSHRRSRRIVSARSPGPVVVVGRCAGVLAAHDALHASATPLRARSGPRRRARASLARYARPRDGPQSPRAQYVKRTGDAPGSPLAYHDAVKRMARYRTPRRIVVLMRDRLG